MSRAPLSFKASLSAWRSMAGNLAAHLDEMPQLRDLQEALQAIVDRGTALIVESSAHEASLRAVNHEKTVVFEEGRELRNQLAVGLQAAMGLHSERLLEFGVRPRPRETRRNRPSRAERAELAAEGSGAKAEAKAAPAGAVRKGEPGSVN